MKKYIVGSVVAMSLLFTITGCGSNGAEDQPGDQVEQSDGLPLAENDGQQPEPDTNDNGNTEDVVDEPTNDHANIDFSNWVEATFVGWVDPHTIEVNVNGQPISMQVSETMTDIVKEIKDGQPVILKAVKNSSTFKLDLLEISTQPLPKEDPNTPVGAMVVQGDFVGFVDPHTIEVLIEEGTETLQVDSNIASKIETNIKTGDPVRMTIEVDENGHAKLVDIKKDN